MPPDWMCLLLAHDLIRKPVPTFRDHALIRRRRVPKRQQTVKIKSLECLHPAPLLEALRHGGKSDRLEAPGRDMEEGKLVESRLQRKIAHRSGRRDLLFLLQPGPVSYTHLRAHE